MTIKDKQVIGRVAKLDIKAADLFDIPAKIDTGAFTSSIWATNVHEKDGRLFYTLLGPEAEQYNGKELSTKDFKIVNVRNSFGEVEKRYRIHLSVCIDGRKIKASFTLANREVKAYPALIGRRTLNKRFVVDVSHADTDVLVKTNWR